MEPTEGTRKALIVSLSVKIVVGCVHMVMEPPLGQRVKVLPHGFAGSRELCRLGRVLGAREVIA